MREVAGRSRVLQTKFGDRFRERAGEARRLSYGSEIGQAFRREGSVNDSRGERFHAESRYGSQRETAHGLRRQICGKLRQRQRVNALATRGKSAGGEFIGGGSRGRDDKDFRVIELFGEERGGPLKEHGVGAGMKECARDHRQLYWVVSRLGQRDRLVLQARHESPRLIHIVRGGVVRRADR